MTMCQARYFRSNSNSVFTLYRQAGIVCFLCGVLFLVFLSGAFAEGQPKEFDIPSQPMKTALDAFAQQSALQMLYTLEVVEGLQSNPVQGTYPPEQALELLLEGTGRTFQFADEHTVTVVKMPGSPDSRTLSNDASAQESKPIQVPEIVVKDVRDNGYVETAANTATRTDMPLIQVPQSVEVVTRKVMDDQKAIRVEQAIRNVSGMALGDIGQSGLAADVALCRGFPCGYFKNYLRNIIPEQAVAYRDIANMQRIEVLKGPASVLYGRSEPGGIVSILTKQPVKEPYAAVDLVFGSYDLYRPMVDISGTLNKDKTLLFRFNGAYENTGSFRDFVDGQRYFAAPVFTWQIGHDTSLTVEGEYIRDNRTPDFGIPAIGDGPASVPKGRFLGEPFDTLKFEEGRAGVVLNHRFNDDWRVESRFRADLAKADAFRVSGNQVLPDNQTLSRTFYDQLAETSSYYWRNDLFGSFHTGSFMHEILTGVELGRQYASYDVAFSPFTNIDIFSPVYNQATVPSISRMRFVHSFANALGTYIQDQIALLDNLHLLAGFRFDYFYQHSNVLGGETKATNYGYSPRIGLTYLPVEQVAVYANFTRSFIPTFGPFAAASKQFDPTTGTQYEVGVKIDVVPNRLTATLAVYRILKKDVLATDPNNPFLFVQSGEQRSQGIELDIAAQLMPGWKVIATYAYTDARVTEDTTIQEGNRLPLIARNTGSLWTTYDIQRGPLQGFGVGLGFFAVGERAGDINNTFELPGYVRTDAALYYRKPQIISGTNLVAQLNIQNLLDQDYFYSGGQSRAFGAFPGSPLTFLGSIKLEFN
ncbi:MAG: TonB-dependent siderophore receptor [Nitrospirales bacterium]